MSEHTKTPWGIFESKGFAEIRHYHEDGFILVSDVDASADVNTITPTIDDARQRWHS